MGSLKNKVAVVTGGNSGIGLATAQEFLAQGATVVITGRNEQAIAEAKAQSDGRLEGYVSDQSNLADIQTLADNVRQRHGKVDVLFINAGIGSFAPLEHVDEQHFDSIMNVNFKGALFTLKHFTPLLSPGASVIFLSSVNAYTGMPNTAVYASSKAAVNSIMRTAATELAPKGIRVNAINPGPIETPFFGKTGLPQEAVDGFAAAVTQRIPLKRFGKAAEVAKFVAFIASDDAAFITGAELNIDGGINVNSILN